jgi:hypothetical protein
MPKLLALAWRVLLVAALVLNPAAAGMAFADPGAPEASTAAGAMPPCHDMADSPGAPSPEPDHGCDCGSVACQFGGCCLTGALQLTALRFTLPAHLEPQPLPVRSGHGAAPPPIARLIRPPIA